ncbi:glucuronate isomerase [Sporosarcina pasteurii]|uniref:Uronate isomerase n=1 Tax=Sporosarcina pasteurii TaxID=1474 RepID=A0A380BDD7_SPOPA|nr:glucuronate isomerase [Sporosarcina pasteurii]MDS9472491.1 glucuronate isomerase [Sporosarcina pasteurii]QBQ06046.1 glucuronate isomerase [Sporosarcina pasteurii]SUI99629.1 Uronate isomerase [Sporosarcina pasteurii]
MKTFITDDFLLYNETAKILYHETAKDLPILDYHNHLNQHEILENKRFNNLAEVWLGGDHYKWRAMRANGIEEAYITGDKSDYDKFLAWSKTVPNTFGNPLYHWTHLELLRYFDIDELLNEQSAPAIWEEANAKLQSADMTARTLLTNKKVEFVGTTDDPTDDLASHIELHKEGFDINVSPSFRPDKGLNIERNDYLAWVDKLEEVTNTSIENYSALLDALKERIDFFDAHGCRSSDHGIERMFYAEATKEEVDAIFSKRLQGQPLTADEVEKYKTYTLVTLGEWYAEKGWAMQLHLSPLRNNSTRMFKRLGADAGFDSMGDYLIADKLSGFLDELDKNDKLPKTILYSLNASDNNILAAMAGNYQNSEIPGKVQFGTAWWFNDTIEGMEDQMKTLANFGLISNFIGMLTDSRSFLSFPRHEYFRRILCNLLGTWVEEGKVPKDIPLLKQYVYNICYGNAKRYFGLNE